jgi:NADPH:quinone reductase-like Zn-dependent oxidoreductase
LRNTELLESLGATHVVDRNIPASSFASKIATITTKPITLVYDSIAAADTQQLGYDTLAEGGHIVVVLQPTLKETPGSTKKVVRVLGNVQETANRAIGRVLAQHLPALLEAGDIVVCTCFYASHLMVNYSLALLSAEPSRDRAGWIEWCRSRAGQTEEQPR